MAINRENFYCAFLEMTFGQTILANGSGFVIVNNNEGFLVTARHNLTGRDQNTGETLHSQGGIPDTCNVYLWAKLKNNIAVKSLVIRIRLDTGDSSIWMEHPTFGAISDVAIIRLKNIDGFDFLGFNLDPYISAPSTWSSEVERMHPDLQPMARLVIAGFPFGKSAGHEKLPIWSSALLASELSIPIDSHPKFYVDCRARRGQSGSPVFFWSSEIDMEGGGKTFMTQNMSMLLGVYSGRINKDSDIGVVWKTEVIREILRIR